LFGFLLLMITFHLHKQQTIITTYDITFACSQSFIFIHRSSYVVSWRIWKASL
jgi:rRNA maturation protein Rpf1